MDEAKLNPNSLATATRNRTKQPQIYRYLKSVAKEPKRSTLAPVAEHFSIPVDALFDPRVADQVWAERFGDKPSVAQAMSLLSPKVLPRVTWGDLGMTELPARFEAAAPDDSMTPRVRAGEIVTYSSEVAAKPGDGVLVRDSAGNHFLRIYRERRPGQWEAHALNDAYQPLDSERDGLVVLAVLMAVEQRWSA